MGTNYYAIPIKKINELEELKEKALNEAKDMKGLIPIITEYFDTKIIALYDKEKYHIGKSSGGWDFLFQLNDKKYYHDKASMIEFIKECQIVDEYDRELTFDDFWNNVVLDRTWNGLPTKKHRDNGYSDYIVIDDLEFLDVEFS